MSLTLAALVFLFLLWLLVLVRYSVRCLRIEREGRRYLAIISALRPLFEHLPQHRGMANAYLQGDETFKAKLSETQRQIEKDIEGLDQLLSACDDALIGRRWHRLKSDWQALKSGLGAMAAAESFQAHTNLVTEVIYLFDDAAARSSVCQADSNMTKLREIVFCQLPVMVEFIARARGIGTGVASRQKLSVADRVKLGFLSSRVEQAVSQSSQVLASMPAAQGVQVARQSVVEESRQLTLNFVQLLNGSLLGADEVQIKPAAFYEAGTAAISKNLVLFDGLLPVILDQAARSQQQLRSRIKQHGIAMAVLGMGLIALIGGF